MTVQTRTDPREAIQARVGELLEQEHWTREQLLVSNSTSAPFSRLHDVRQFQVVHDADGLLVRIVPREDAGPALPEQVRAAIAGEMTSAGADVSVRVELARAIERESGPAGKVKLVRSAV